MYCQECGKEAQPGEVICASCGGALTDAELDLPEVEAFPVSAADAQTSGTAPAQSGPAAAGRSPGPPGLRPEPALTPAPQPQAPLTGPRLDARVGNLSGSYPLNRSVITIGRADAASGHQPDVDLSVDPAVSRRHAEIRHSADGYRIIDLGSTNGTVVNGKQIPRQQEIALADGDEVRIGENCALTVRL